MTEDARNAVLEAVLNAQQLQVSIVATPEFCGRWFEKEAELQRGSFHLIDSGCCWVRSPALPAPVQLSTGDLIVFPRGSAHTLCSSAGEDGPGDGFSTLICGEFEFANAQRNPVVQALPAAFVVRADEGGEAFRDLGRVLSHCARRGLPGQRVLMNKLADSLFVMAVCVYAERAGDPRGLLAALAEPRLARALAALHAEPGRDWRLDALARIAGMSRTAFAGEFSALLGISPIQYLTQWRIAEARRLLHDRRLSVAAIAERLGYQSEAAFRRTFKRIEGVGPGEIRRSAV